MHIPHRRLRSFTAGVAVAALGLALAGCAADIDTTPVADTTDVDCAPYAAYQGHAGKAVTLIRSLNNTDIVRLTKALRDFSDCTSIRVVAEGSKQVEADTVARAGTTDAPDLAVLSQPGIITQLAREGKVEPVSAKLAGRAESIWAKDLLGYATVGGKLYATPFSTSVKSLVWYSPTVFAKKGYQVPKSWAEMEALNATIIADGGTPWCDGFGSGGATGWPGTDWIEEAMLRLYGPEVYDQWVAHEIPFDDPKVSTAFDWVGKILKNDRSVLGGGKSVAKNEFAGAGIPILEEKCYLYRMAAFYGSFWPRGTEVAADGDIFAFYTPAIDPSKGTPVEISGDYVAAFSDRPEVAAVQEYMASEEFAARIITAKFGIPANGKVSLDLYTNPVDRLSAEILRDPKAILRFDGSDLMPAAVGAGTFWSEISKWVAGQSTADSVLAIEKSWP